jgi:hypothetical protein
MNLWSAMLKGTQQDFRENFGGGQDKQRTMMKINK